MTVHGGPPGVPPVSTATSSAPPLAPRVEPQTPRADGSLVHVVREGDTLWTICVAYGLDTQDMQDLVERNGLDDGGRLLRVGQELRIREADGA